MFRLALALLGIGLACRDIGGPANPGLLPPKILANSMQALPAVTVTLPATPSTSVALPTYAFTEGVSVEISITGLLAVTSDPRSNYVHYNGSIDGAGIWEGGVYQQCSLYGHVYYSAIPGTEVGLSGCSPPNQRTAWVDTMIVNGSGSARRGPTIAEPTGQCGASPCHTWSGEQTVKITPLAADLKLTQNRTFVPSLGTASNRPQYVNFIASPIPTTMKNQGTPTKHISRTWRRADPRVVSSDTTIPGASCSPGLLNCNLPVKESGTYIDSVRVNGVVHVDSASVDCATGDSVYDSKEIRATFVKTILASDNPNILLRKELGGFVYRRTSDGSYFPVPDTLATSDDCNFHMGPAPLIAGAELVGQYHTHPGMSPDSARACVDKQGHPYNKWVPIDPAQHGGGSPEADWQATGDGYPRYVVSLHGEVFKLNGGSQNLTIAQMDANPNRWWWRNPSPDRCRWVSAPAP